MKAHDNRSDSARVAHSSLYAVVMAGGAGTRLWPESRKIRPKPFLPMTRDGRALIRATFDRLDGLVAPENRFVVAGRAFAGLVAETLPDLRPDRALFEPTGRNTAPCVAWSALEALRLDPDPTLVVLPSDHWISPDAAFRATLADAIRLVNEAPARLVALGIKPTEPSPAFGYVERGDVVPNARGAFHVKEFHEKPDPETAAKYLASGRFFWNAGVFVWKARRILELIREFEPSLAATLDVLAERIAARAQEGRRVDEDLRFVAAFSAAKDVSIDYAVLERAPKIVVLAADSFEWNDVGSFAALERLGVPSATAVEIVSRDASGNYARVAPGTVVSDDPAPRPKKVVALGNVDNLLIVDSGNALMIAPRDDDATIRTLAAELAKRGLDAFKRPGVPSPGAVEIVSCRASDNDVRVVSGAEPDGVATRPGKVVALGRVDNLLIVDAGDALMIARKDNDATIRSIVAELEKRGLDAFL